MLPIQVALVSDTNAISPDELTQVSAALQRQVIRDFAPLWNVQATVDAFPTLEQLPLGYWPIIVRDDISAPGAAGFHQDPNGQPFALVQYSDTWAFTASHECLEMLADPTGNRVIAGASVPEYENSPARVEYLVEVCDPCESSDFSYTVNGITVSDFITPHFYDPVASTGIQYSYTGVIPGPHRVLAGGYLSFHDPQTDHWLQLQFFGNAPQIQDLGPMQEFKGSLRTMIDSITPHPELERGINPQSTLFAERTARRDYTQVAGKSRAEALRKYIESLMG